MAQTKTVPPATKRPKTLAGSIPAAADHARAEMIGHYEAALRLMQEGKYEKAHAAFDKMLAGGPGELGDRVRMYINACLLQVAKGKTSFSSHEEHYDYAFYGLAVLASMTGDSHTCLEHLTEAIRQNPRNRIQARADSDFQDMADDPRFPGRVYPEFYTTIPN